MKYYFVVLLNFLKRHAIRVPSFLVLGLVSLLLAGCFKDEVKKLQDESRAWQRKFGDTNKELEQYRKQWDTFGNQMVTAADSVDPLAIKEMLRQNKKLEDANKALQTLLDDRSSEGMLYLDSGELMLRLPKFKGEMYVNIWIGDLKTRTNQVGELHLRNTAPSLNFNFNLGANSISSKETVQETSNINSRFRETATKVDKQYETAMKQLFSNFVTINAYETPSDSNNEWYLRDLLLSGGRRDINLEVIPKSAIWDLTIELSKVGGDKKSYPLKTYQLTSDKDGINPVIQTMTIWVKYPNK